VSGPDEHQQVVFRPGIVDDAESITHLFDASRRDDATAMPLPVHPPETFLAFFSEILRGDAQVWVAESPVTASVVGFVVLQDDWVHSLYVHPQHTGHGVGSTLLDLAKVQRPAGLRLYVFESNLRARAFYERHGLVAVGRSDGTMNEEREPDLTMLWPGEDAIAALRIAIDELDAQIARLLDLRAGVTAAIQGHKPVDQVQGTHRDFQREREIVERMGILAPRLGSKRLAVIMQAVIAQSLDASRAADLH